MPVRVKSRALAHQKPDESEREWEDLKQLLVALALANDQLAKLVITDGSKGKKITIRPPNQGQLAGELDLQRTSSILAQAGLINFQNSNDCWNIVSACVPDFSIHAAICLVPSPTKRVQFISLGMTPVFSPNSTNILYSDLNRLFASSDFGTPGTSASVQNPLENGHISAKALPKAVNKWPMFYVRINTNTSDKWYEDGQEIAPESDKSVKRILDVLAAMINEFLAQLNLRPRVGKRKRKVTQVSPEAVQEDSKNARQSRETREDRSKGLDSTEKAFDGRLKLPSFKRPVPPTTSQHFGDWSRVKGAKDVIFDTKLNATKSVNIPSRVRSPAKSQQPAHSSGGEREPTTDTTIPWTDPYKERTHMVNSQTGQSTDSYNACERPRSTGYIKPDQVLDRVRRSKSAIATGAGSLWIDGVLKTWENPTFSRSERPINSIDIGAHEHESDRATFNAHDCCGDLCRLNTVKFSKFRGKLWKQHLQGAKVVAQVDRKFVFAKLPTSSIGDAQDGTALVLIDQHAADERCRVERLFEELFTSESGDFGGVQTIPVEPITFEAPLSEKTLLKRYRNHFLSWGVGYRVEQATNKLCVFIHLLPALIAERCRTEPSLVTDLIRGEIWKCEESGNKPCSTTARLDLNFGSTTTSWVELLTGCPQGIIDLLNSRACRTAIMFNDILSIPECQQLVAQLAQCAFPFQCAHGRPSMIPILDIEVQDSSLLVSESLDSLGLGLEDGDETSRVGFVEAFGMAYKSENIE